MHVYPISNTYSPLFETDLKKAQKYKIDWSNTDLKRRWNSDTAESFLEDIQLCLASVSNSKM